MCWPLLTSLANYCLRRIKSDVQLQITCLPLVAKLSKMCSLSRFSAGLCIEQSMILHANVCFSRFACDMRAFLSVGACLRSCQWPVDGTSGPVRLPLATEKVEIPVPALGDEREESPILSPTAHVWTCCTGDVIVSFMWTAHGLQEGFKDVFASGLACTYKTVYRLGF